MSTAVIIVAGGSGLRMGGPIPKQFALLCGRPVLMHTIEKFYNTIEDANIIVVLPKQEEDRWSNLCSQYGFNIPHIIVFGGKNRFDSVRNGLVQAYGCDIVAIHDGVRPLVSSKVILDALETAKKHGSAVPAIPVTDTLRKYSVNESMGIDRSGLFAVQTPQCFKGEIIMDSYDTEFSPLFTDDASVAEAKGYSITLTEGDPLNIKLTTPSDMLIAEAVLSATRIDPGSVDSHPL
ncbi:MAG: 2-C-methyl-D-erythritol 4-phosphate cytidylyltransferase [Rikenellaceae bacterium]|nr:2-C-methyl-D-erythritol 4-phosphate cytidylyltransferase [Rikenellaceae bacterium]